MKLGLAGHCPLRMVAKPGSMSDGGVEEMRSEKDEQWERPMVWEPESTTRSSTSRPLALKLSTSTVRLKDGGGRKASVSLSKDTRPSRRPAGRL